MGYEALVFRAGMRLSGGKSRRSGWRVACPAAAVLVALVVAESAVAAPAVEQYDLRLPDARGEASVGQTAPQSHPEELPAAVRQQLEKSPDGAALASIATADELRAPQGRQGGIDDESTDERGILSAAGSTLGDPAGIAVLLALAAIAGAIVALQRSRAGRGGS
jgi:hypothetical protein